jgi:hypothetical protein
MEPHRIFRFAHAGVLVALLHATTTAEEGDFDEFVFISLAIAIPATVFRGLIAGHKYETAYKAASGFAGQISIITTVAAFAFTFWNHSQTAAALFLIASIGVYVLLRFGKRSK